MQNILITGSNGFIGTNLLKFFSLQKNTRVLGLVRQNCALEYANLLGVEQFLVPFSSSQDIRNIFCNFQPTTVIHLATKFVRSDDYADTTRLIESNISFGTEILAASLISGTSIVINASSNWQ